MKEKFGSYFFSENWLEPLKLLNVSWTGHALMNQKNRMTNALVLLSPLPDIFGCKRCFLS
jgi:hypothetical protein